MQCVRLPMMKGTFVCLFGLFQVGQYAQPYRWMGDIPLEA